MLSTAHAAVVNSAPVQYNGDISGIFLYLFREKRTAKPKQNKGRSRLAGFILFFFASKMTTDRWHLPPQKLKGLSDFFLEMHPCFASSQEHSQFHGLGPLKLGHVDLLKVPNGDIPYLACRCATNSTHQQCHSFFLYPGVR